MDRVSQYVWPPRPRPDPAAIQAINKLAEYRSKPLNMRHLIVFRDAWRDGQVTIGYGMPGWNEAKDLVAAGILADGLHGEYDVQTFFVVKGGHE